MNMTTRNRKLIPIAIAAVGVILTAWAAFAFFAGSGALEVSGLVQAREVENASRFGGRIRDIPVDEGDNVKAGQTLIVFDDVEINARLAEARAALDQALAKEKLLVKGADLAEIYKARAALQQAKENLRLLQEGARPEEVAQVRAKVESAKSRLQNARTQYENAEKMLAEGIISRQKYESIQSAYEAAQGAYESAEAGLRLVQQGSPEQISLAQSRLAAARTAYKELLQGAEPEEMAIVSAAVEKARSLLDALKQQRDEVKLKAPIDGLVSVIGVDRGELVQPGRPVISVVNYKDLWADVYVPESRLSLVQVDEPVTVTAPGMPGVTFEGRVALINPESEFVPTGGGGAGSSSEESKFRVKIDIEHMDTSGKVQLYRGMKINVRFDR